MSERPLQLSSRAASGSGTAPVGSAARSTPSPGHSRGTAWPLTAGTLASTAVPRGARLFSSPPGVCARSPPAAGPFLPSAVPAGAAAAVRAAPGGTRGARARTGCGSAHRPSPRGIPADHRTCRATSPHGTGLCPATTHPCSQVTSRTTLGRTAHRGAPAHGDWLLAQSKIKLS